MKVMIHFLLNTITSLQAIPDTPHLCKYL